MLGCSVQYAENSDSEIVPRIKGGAVRDERSPLNEAMDFTNAFISVSRAQCWEEGQAEGENEMKDLKKMAKWCARYLTRRNVDHEPLFCGATPAPSSDRDEDMAAAGFKRMEGQCLQVQR